MINDLSWRIAQLIGIDKWFPEQLFMCGNKATLSVPNIQEELSLISKPALIEYSDEFAGTIVEYEFNRKTCLMHIVLSLPSVFHLFKHRPIEYLQEILKSNENNSILNKLDGLASRFNVDIENCKRTTTILVECELTAL